MVRYPYFLFEMGLLPALDCLLYSFLYCYFLWRRCGLCSRNMLAYLFRESICAVHGLNCHNQLLERCSDRVELALKSVDAWVRSRWDGSAGWGVFALFEAGLLCAVIVLLEAVAAVHGLAAIRTEWHLALLMAAIALGVIELSLALRPVVSSFMERAAVSSAETVVLLEFGHGVYRLVSIRQLIYGLVVKMSARMPNKP